MKPIKQSTVVKATPQQVYDTLMDSAQHTKLTNAKADISPEVGGLFTAYNGYISGKNIELKSGELIVQEWQANDDNWPKGIKSTVKFELKEVPGGTRLDFTHEGVPKSAYKNIEQGWIDNYWKQLEEKFGKLEG